MCRLLFTNINGVSKDKFLDGLSLMKHGGPDAPLCYYGYKNAKFGHNRLSILDLNPRSNQPFFSSDKNYCIIFNGEVYNYLELANEFDIKMETTSDTELILKLSLKIGYENAVKKLNGMFSYIIYNLKTGCFFVARDRLGIKPLYYYESKDGCIISSEINALISICDEQLELDSEAIRQYRLLRTFFNGKTIYKQIKMFPAGSFMDENGKIQKYWELPNVEQEPPTDEELRSLIEDSVRLRKIADVPLGAFLSGGLDSTIISALTGATHTWTVGFKENNEFEWGKIASDFLNTKQHEILIDKELFLSDLDEMLKIRKEPLSVPNEVLIYEMSKAVKKENTVVLCGEGADELFFGYDRIFRWASSTKNFDIKEFSSRYVYGSECDYEILESVIEPFYKYGTPEKIVAAFFQIAHLHGLLRRVDNSTMLCAVEARVPFCDHRLVERMAGVSSSYRMKDGIVKAPLKRIFEKDIPTEMITRKKIGFPVPTDSIFGVESGKGYDAWLNHNLSLLGLE